MLTQHEVFTMNVMRFSFSMRNTPHNIAQIRQKKQATFYMKTG